MKITCPHCREKYDPLEATREEDLRAIIAMQPKFGEHSRLVFEYIERFWINPLTWRTKKIRRLLSGMVRLFDGKYSYQKKVYEISPAWIAEALTIVCNKQLNGVLENHNYLKKVMIGISGVEEKERSKQGERDMRKKEKRLQAGETIDKSGAWGEVDAKEIKEFNRKRGHHE